MYHTLRGYGEISLKTSQMMIYTFRRVLQRTNSRLQMCQDVQQDIEGKQNGTETL